LSWLRACDLADCLRVLVTGDTLHLATAVVEQVQPRGAWEANQHLTARAVLSAARGELDEAAELYRDAAEGWAWFGNVV
jgi:hypothetical protein